VTDFNIEHIWKSVLAGDVHAWGDLVRVYAALVNTVARRVGLSTVDAEDCAQHTWLSLYRNRRVIKDPQALPAWLIRTTHRQAVYLYKKRIRTSEAEADRAIEPQLTLPDEEVHRLEQRAIIELALGRIDGRCRRLLEQLFFAPDEKSYQQIARELGIAPNTMGPLRSRCLKRLRRILDEMGFEWD
jgi:RNA polymerase sigma factor (sigma-70 family)